MTKNIKKTAETPVNTGVSSVSDSQLRAIKELRKIHELRAANERAARYRQLFINEVRRTDLA